MSVALRVSDSTPRRAERVRFYGWVQPEHDGRRVLIQRRTSSGRYATVARAILRDAGANRSRYSRRVRVYSDGTFRALVRGDSDHATGKSRRRHLNVL